jgi:hypothetical protein
MRPTDVAVRRAVRVEALDAIHERAHEEQASAVLALDVQRIGRIADVAVEVEGLALVLHVDDETHRVDGGAHAHALVWIFVVRAKDRVRDRLTERDRHVERELVGVVRQLGAGMSNELDDALDVRDVARDLDFEIDAKPGVGREGRGHVGSGGGARWGTSRQRRRVRGPARGGGPREESEARECAVARIRDLEQRVELRELEQRLESSLRLARPSSPPCSRIFLESETRTPSPELSM